MLCYVLYQEVESPHHLKEAKEAEVLLDVKERKVAEPGHPHVARNKYADGVIHLIQYTHNTTNQQTNKATKQHTTKQHTTAR